jgi:hypothetical protein
MKKRWIILSLLLILFLPIIPEAFSEETQTILFHLKTGLKHDDAQICVAYNEIWAALEEGLKDDIQEYKLPERLRKGLATQFEVPLEQVPETYGAYLEMLNQKGAQFYINSAFLVLAKIEEQMGTVENVSAKFFQPITLKNMLKLRTTADYYLVY